MKGPMSLEEIRNYDKEFLTPMQASGVLGVTPYSINIQAKQDRERGTKSFPFDVMLIGTRCKILRKSLLKAIDGGEVTT